MKLSEIVVGETYQVQIPEDVDRYINEHADRGTVEATVVAKGLNRTIHTTRGSRIHGLPFHREHDSANGDGVEVEWDEQDVRWRFGRGGETTHIPAGKGVIIARSVKRVAT